jgi:hypothetical protein
MERVLLHDQRVRRLNELILTIKLLLLEVFAVHALASHHQGVQVRDLKEQLVDAVDQRQLQAQLVQVACAYLAEHLALELLATRQHHLLRDLEPLVVNERLCIYVSVEDVLVQSQQVNDRVCLDTNTKILALHVEQAVSVEVVDV